MLKALLLDLDGTLLPMDTDAFLRQYLRSIGQHVAHLTDPRQFTEHLMAATEVMIRDTDKKVSNQEVFWADFLQRVDVPADKLLPVVDDFYVTRFPELKEHTFPTPLSKKIVETAGDKGLQVFIKCVMDKRKPTKKCTFVSPKLAIMLRFWSCWVSKVKSV